MAESDWVQGAPVDLVQPFRKRVKVFTRAGYKRTSKI
jgi:hypothetical protein